MWRLIVNMLLVVCLGVVHADHRAEYDQDSIALNQWLYGYGHITLGGQAAIDDMYRDIELKGMEILNLGCGLGAAEISLASKLPDKIIGVDPDNNMVNQARQMLARKSPYIQQRVHFTQLNELTSLVQFEDETFDIVTTKETLRFVPFEQKLHYFKEMWRVLKPGGMLIMLDWMHASPNYSDDTIEMFELEGVSINLATPFEYKQLIAKANFQSLQFKDKTCGYKRYSDRLVNRLERAQTDFVERFNPNTYDFVLKSAKIKSQCFASRELMVGMITAKKL